jgi:ABC-2 type transport system ATP-binding protein
VTAPLLAARRVSRDFGAFRAVDDVSIELAPGEVVGLLGANGAGKTTVIRLLLGLLAPTSGAVTMLGGAPDRERRRHLGYVPQGLGLYGDLTVAENLAFVASTYGTAVPRSDRLAPVAGVLVRELPLGLQRRVAFTAALAHSPSVLVLDEPSSGVDPLARAELWETVRAQAAAGVGVLVTTHYMQEAEQCDRLLLMADGRLVAEGGRSDIVGSTRALLVTPDSSDDWAAVFDLLDGAGELVMLAGRCVRVADGDRTRITALLATAGLACSVDEVPATIEERMAVLAAGPG